MGLPWVRLDAGFYCNAKVLQLLAEPGGHRALVAYVASLTYSGQQGTDGFIPQLALPFIHARPADAVRLVKAEFWDIAQGGWVIHDWAEYQPSSEEQQKRSARARARAQARWQT